jgi:hypothetical protein
MLVRGGLIEPRSPEAGGGALPPSIPRPTPPGERPETAPRVSSAGSIDRGTVAARRPASRPANLPPDLPPTAAAPGETARPPAPPRAAAAAAARSIDRDTVMRAMRDRAEAVRSAAAPARTPAEPVRPAHASAPGPDDRPGGATTGSPAGAVSAAAVAPVVRRSPIADSVAEARAARPTSSAPAPQRIGTAGPPSTVLLEREHDHDAPADAAGLAAAPFAPARPGIELPSPLDVARVATTPAAAAAAAAAAQASVERAVAERNESERAAATPRPTTPIVRRLAEVAPSVADVRDASARDASAGDASAGDASAAPWARATPAPPPGPAGVPSIPPTVRPPSPTVAHADPEPAHTIRRTPSEAPTESAAPLAAPMPAAERSPASPVAPVGPVERAARADRLDDAHSDRLHDLAAPAASPPADVGQLPVRPAAVSALVPAAERRPASPGAPVGPVERAGRADRLDGAHSDRLHDLAAPAASPPADVGQLPVRPAVVPALVPAIVPAAETVRRAVDPTAGTPGMDRVTASDVRRLRHDERTSERQTAPALPRALAADPLAAPAPTFAPTSVPARVTSRIARPDAPVTGRSGVAVPAAAPGRPSVRPAAPGAPALDAGTFAGTAPARATRETVRRSPAEPIRRRATPLATAGIASVAGASGTSDGGLLDAIVRGPVGDAPIADRFMAELSRTRAARPTPLPERLRPMADLIAGGAAPRVSHDVASRQALRSVGKLAATVGDVIHLDRSVNQVPTEVLAHELTHVAHPSPAPRFFADDRPSAEERRAETIGKLMRSTAPAVIRRAPSQDTTPGSGAISAAALAGQITGTGGDNVIRRWNTAAPRGSSRSAATIGANRGGSASAPASAPVPAPAAPSAPSARSAPSSPADQSATQAPDLVSQFDRILELLEERVLRELERRGGRLRGGF